MPYENDEDDEVWIGWVVFRQRCFEGCTFPDLKMMKVYFSEALNEYKIMESESGYIVSLRLGGKKKFWKVKGIPDISHF